MNYVAMKAYIVTSIALACISVSSNIFSMNHQQLSLFNHARYALNDLVAWRGYLYKVKEDELRYHGYGSHEYPVRALTIESENVKTFLWKIPIKTAHRVVLYHRAHDNFFHADDISPYSWPATIITCLAFAAAPLYPLIAGYQLIRGTA